MYNTNYKCVKPFDVVVYLKCLLWQLCTPVSGDTLSYLLQMMICPHTSPNSSKRAA